MKKQIKTFFSGLDQLVRTGAKGLIRIYQLTFSPDKSFLFSPFLRGRICRHQPHCSQYGLECFDHFDFLTASFRTMDRVSRCTPGVNSTYDPVTYRTVFASGSPIGVPFLEELMKDPRFDVVGILTMPDMPSGRGMKMQENVIGTTAKILQTTNLYRSFDKVILMHGKDTNSQEKRYPRFAEQIRELGIPCYIPDLPNANNPDIKEWIDILIDMKPTSKSLLIGHSRGGVAILRALEGGYIGSVAKTILVATNSGYSYNTREEEDNKGFYTHNGFNFDSIRKVCKEFTVFHSTDDQRVPYEHGLENMKGLSAKFLSFTDKGHFGNNLIISGFPDLIDDITGITTFIQKPHSLRLESKKYAQEAKETYERLQSLDIDILYVVAYGNILPQHILDIPKIAPINIHGSLLPAYRGASPLQQVFVDGLSETGVTLMKMEAGLDSGPMIDKQIFKLKFSDTVADLIQKVKEHTPHRSLNSIDAYVHGELEEQEQDESLVSYCGKISKEDGFIVLMTDSLELIYAKYKAFVLRPKLWFIRGDKRIVIEELVVDEVQFEINKTDLLQEHGQLNPAIQKILLKPEGKKTMSWDDFARGYLSK